MVLAKSSSCREDVDGEGSASSDGKDDHFCRMRFWCDEDRIELSLAQVQSSTQSCDECRRVRSRTLSFCDLVNTDRKSYRRADDLALERECVNFTVLD